MLAGILIIAFSLGLLIYWFRYACLLIVRNWQEEAASMAVDDTRFSFPKVRENLAAGSELGPLQIALDRDYRILRYLMEHAAGLEPSPLEDRLLVADYRIMQCVYRITRLAAPDSARHALSEMATVLGILAHRLGTHANVPGEA